MQSINAGFGGAATNKQGAVFAGAKIARNEAVGPSLPCLQQLITGQDTQLGKARQ